MSRNTWLLVGITLLFVLVVTISNNYGPSRRIYLASPRVQSADTTAEIARAWDASGARGRIVICFTRYLNALQGKESQDFKVTETAMEKGIIRRVYHVPPAGAWPEIQASLSKRSDMRPTQEGFIGIFDYGRVYIQPIDQLAPLQEKALIVIEPGVWTPAEIARISGMLQSGKIMSDFILIIRGTEDDVARFRAAISGNK